jgi:hypothetical protein
MKGREVCSSLQKRQVYLFGTILVTIKVEKQNKDFK